MRKFKFNGEVEVTDKISGGGVRDLINTIYPVGISLDFKLNVNPNTTWPWQTWVEWGQGCVVVGAGTYSDGTTSKTFALGDTGGEYNHTLTQAEMPPHNHKCNEWGDWFNYSAAGNYAGAKTYEKNPHGFDYGVWTTQTGGVNGVTQSHNNIQPYVVGKRWTRTV